MAICGQPMLKWLLVLLVSVGLNETVAFLPQPCSIPSHSTAKALFEASLDTESMLYDEQERLLVERGQIEWELLTNGPYAPMPLEAAVVKGAGGGGGFGGGGSKKSFLKTQGKALASVLREQGVIRIDNALPSELADEILENLAVLRKESEALVESGEFQRLERFANVLLKENRVDMTIPLGHEDEGAKEWVAQALASVLSDSPVGSIIQTILGNEALLYEWSCMMSDPSSNRQVLHPDTPYKEEPVLLTCFIALQDIELDMGPTSWMPGTHNSPEIHAQFRDEIKRSEDEFSAKEQLLVSRPTVLGTLRKGSCAIFDSRLLHAGGANTSSTSRAILYFTFQNPMVTNVGNPGSIRPYLIGQWTLQKMQKELSKYQKGKASEVCFSL